MALSPRLARAIGAVGAIGAALPLAAQPASPRAVPSTYAITNARLVPVSGPVIERGTLVVRNGLIAAIGASVAVPADARVVDGAGLTVYPGFIDGLSTLGMAPPPRTGAAAAAVAASAPSRSPRATRAARSSCIRSACCPSARRSSSCAWTATRSRARRRAA